MITRVKIPRRILVPFDGSKPSETALQEAVMFAENLDGVDITLLTVVQEIPIQAGFGTRFRSEITGENVTAEALAKELAQKMKEKAARVLIEKKEEIQRMIQDKHPQIRTKVVLGLPAEKIIELAKDEKMDMIIIGNVGLSGVSRIKALGSVSRGVSEKAPCPVLIVH